MKIIFSLMMFTTIFISTNQSKASLTVASQGCVHVYYDQGPSDYWIGRTYAVFMQNLLGHFPEVQQIISPIEAYKKGDIEQCRATIYISSFFDSKIPADFYTDYATTTKNVAWLGYNIWKLEQFSEIFGFNYQSLTKLNTENLDFELKPTFFKWIDYKGERFFKYGDWSKLEPTKFLCPFEMTFLIPKDSVSMPRATVLATATHNFSNETLPYILRNKNHFYVADVPFSYMHEADRYLVFSDLLFDILNLPPRNSKRMALIRIEDVHPLVPVDLLYLFTKTLTEEHVPINVSIIPFFFDPLHLYDRKSNQEFVTASQVPQFMQWINDVKKLNARFIWHGVTHQYGRQRNPHDGTSGSDFEFWDANANTPVPKDGVPWALNRLYDGFYELDKIGIHPKIWLTPHYQASTLDNYIFSRVFPWNIGRVIYFNFEFLKSPVPHDEKYWLTDTNIDKQKKRIADLSQVEIQLTAAKWNGQIFPYEIYGDIHGQRILPENLGNSQPFENSHVIKTRSVEDIVRDAKRNLVIRDAWASFFYHPFLFGNYNSGGRGAFIGDPSELVFVLKELKKMGYEFIDVEDFATKNQNLMRPEPIYVKFAITP